MICIYKAFPPISDDIYNKKKWIELINKVMNARSSLD